jgi:hypothetical protein
LRKHGFRSIDWTFDSSNEEEDSAFNTPALPRESNGGDQVSRSNDPDVDGTLNVEKVH